MFLPRTLATTVDGIARKVIGRDWNLYAALLSHWPEIVGEDYARVTTPVKISFPLGKPATEKWAQGRREDGILLIRLPQGLAMEFTYLTDQIRQRIASYFGYNAIERIVFDTYYSTETPVRTTASEQPSSPALQAQVKEKTKDIEDDELRTALEALGQAVIKAPKTP